MSAADTIADEALRTGVLASAKESLRNALKELEQEIRRKNDQISLLVKDIDSYRRERDGLATSIGTLRVERDRLNEDTPTLKKAIDDYRREQLAAITKAGEAAQARETTAKEAERKVAHREQAAQTAESSYAALVDKVASQTGFLTTTLTTALNQVVKALAPPVE